MKQRSANNNTFLCIKIPEIQLLVSYRGSNKDKKNFKDLNNVSLLFPLFEVHDKTWTWLDLINALKSHVKKALLSQAIRHKLIQVPIQPMNKLINRGKQQRSGSQQFLTNLQIDEHERLAMLKLFGSKYIDNNTTSSSRKSLLTNIGPTSAMVIREETAVIAPHSPHSPKVSHNRSRIEAEERSSLLGYEQSTNEELAGGNSMQKSVALNKSEESLAKRASKLVKSNSTIGNAIKKRFFKLTKDKEKSSGGLAAVVGEDASSIVVTAAAAASTSGTTSANNKKLLHFKSSP
jgi:hypothetical protein